MRYRLIEGNQEDLLVLFHQTGGSMESLLDFRALLAPRASVLALEGQVGKGNYRRFFKPLIDGKILNQPDFDQTVSDFLDFWDDLDLTGFERVTFIGYSNGANLILGILNRRPSICHQAILLHPADLGLELTGRSDTLKLCITLGMRDYLIEPTLVARMATTLREKHFPQTRLFSFVGGHEISSEELATVRDWFYSP